MTRMVKLEKWGSKDGSHQQFSIDGVIREHEYYRCFSVTNQYKEKMLLWKLHGAANPFISLLQLFKLYALPTAHIISRQFVRFLVKCWKVFQGRKSMKDFKLQFYYGKSSKPKQVQIIEDEQINKMMQAIETLSNEQLDRFAQQYDSPTLRSNKLLIDQCMYFKSRADENLRDLMVFTQQDKMEKLYKTCSSFRSLWNAQLLYDKTTAFAYIFTSNKLDPNKLDKTCYQMLTLQDVLQLAQKQSSPKVIISEQTIDKFVNNLLDQLEKFEECNLEQWSYPLDLDTVLIEGRRNNGQLHLGSNCYLDIMQPFIKVIGLTNQINTIENLAVFHSKPRPFRISMTFTQTLTNHFKITQPTELSKIQLAIRWMLMAEYIFQSCLQPNGKSLLQTHRQKEKIVEVIIGKDVNCLYHPSIKMLISLIKLKNPEIQSPDDLLRKLTIQNIKMANQDEQGDNWNPFEQSRYALIKNSIDLKVKLYFQRQSLKQFCEKNKSIKSLDSNGKYITLYLLAHYAFMVTEHQFLELWMGQPVHIFEEKDPLFAALAKFIRLTPKIEAQVEKIDKDLAKWESGIREKMENILEYCKTLKGRLFGSFCHNLTTQNREQKLEQMTIMVTQIKDKISYIFSLFKKDFEKEVDSEIKLNSKSTGSYLYGRKNLCFMDIFTNLDLYNYSDLYCQQTAIRNYKEPSNQTTKGDIKEYFDKIQMGLAQCFARGSQFNKDTHTGLNKDQFNIQP